MYLFLVILIIKQVGRLMAPYFAQRCINMTLWLPDPLKTASVPTVIITHNCRNLGVEKL